MDPMKQIGTYVTRITRPAFERHGAAWAELLRNWAAIAGEAARFSRPEKLRTARGKGGGGAAVLHLRVQPGRALELQHMSNELISRINGYFGHAAVGKITFIQAPLEEAEEARRRADDEKRPPAPSAADERRVAELRGRTRAVHDPDLRESLARLAAHVAAGKSSPEG